MEKTPEEVVRALLDVVGTKRPIGAAKALLQEGLVCHMDGKRLSASREAWFCWVGYLHRTAKKRVSRLELVLDRVKARGDRVEVWAFWQGEVDGRFERSRPGKVVYRVSRGRVAEIWTHKANYTFIYGPWVVNPLVFYFWVLRMMLWCKISRNVSG